MHDPLLPSQGNGGRAPCIGVFASGLERLSPSAVAEVRRRPRPPLGRCPRRGRDARGNRSSAPVAAELDSVLHERGDERTGNSARLFVGHSKADSRLAVARTQFEGEALGLARRPRTR